MLTGATGFLGSHFLKALLEETDFTIIVLKRSTSNISRIETELLNRRVTNYDIDCTPLCEMFMKTPAETVVHMATNYGRDDANILQIVETNIILPMQLLQLGVEHGLKTFINTDSVISKEICNYSKSKSHFIEWMSEYADSVKCINLRLELVYGPHDDNTKFVTHIVQSFLKNVSSIDLTFGEQKRHFTHVNDVVNALLCVLLHQESIKFGYSSYDISSNKSVSIKDFAFLARALTGNTSTQLNFGAVPYRVGEEMDVQTDTREIESLGWKPEISLEYGLISMIQQERSSQK